MAKKPFAIALVLLALLFAFERPTAAQGTTSRVTGTVTDSSGAAINGATVTLTNEATDASLTTETSDSGVYNFDLLLPGTYSVTVEKAGFKKFVATGNQALVNQPTTLNAALDVGSVDEVVTVQGAAEQVQTSTSGNVGSTIDQRALESLPIIGLRGRNPLDLINFQPGVVVGSNTGGGVHVHGSRDRAFNFTLDGIDINESTAGGSNFTPLRPNPESIQEFQIVTSNFTAELGRSSGAQVTLVTRSGTNRFAGNIFEFYQTPDFNANEFQNNLQGIGRAQFVQHIYGGSFGGPIVIPGFGEGTPSFHKLKDKAFFFVNLQRLSAVETRRSGGTVYTESARNGIFRYVYGGATNAANGRFVPGRNGNAGTTISATTNPLGASVNADGSPRYPTCVGSPPTNAPCIQSYNLNTNSPVTFDPLVTSTFRSYPLPNNFFAGDGLNTAGFIFNAPQTEKQWDFVSRFDYKINDNNQLYVRYAQGSQNTFNDSVNGGLPRFPDFPGLTDTLRTPKNLAINYRVSPTAKLTNEFIFGYSTFGFSFATPQPRADIPFVLNSVTDAFQNFNYNARKARTFQFVDNVTIDLSPHTIKTGINFRFGRQFDDRSSAGGQIEPQIGFGTGSSSFTGFAIPTDAVAGTSANPTGAQGINALDRAVLQGTVNNFIGRIGSFSQGFVVDPNNPSAFAPAGTRWNWTAYYPEYDFYVQDTWRLRSNLVLDLGLRYEIKLSPTSKDLPILRPNQPFTIGAAPTNTLRWEEGDLFKNDFNNFSPSVGFAYDPFKDGKTSIRANYRLSYDRFPSQVFANSIFQSAPGNTLTGTATGIGSENRLLRDGLPSLVPTQTPDQLRQPVAFSTAGITLVDPDTQYPENHQWFAGVQRELWWNNVLEINYIGRRGVHLFGGYDSNQVNIFAKDSRCSENFLEAFNTLRASTTATSCLIDLLFTGNANDPTHAGTATFRSITAIGNTLSNTTTGGSVAAAAAVVSQRACQAADVTAGRCTSTSQQLIGRTINNPFLFQKFPQFAGALNVLDSNDLSRYNGLEFVLKRRLTNGLGYQLAYTYSVSKDTRSFDPTFATVSRGDAQSASSTPFDINNRNLNYANSDFDRRHVLQATYVAELPVGKGKAFLGDIPKALDFIIGGWQLSGTMNWASGRPFTVYSGINTFSNVNQSFANCSDCPRNLGSLIERNGTNYWFSEEAQAKFGQPLPGELGDTGRNYFIGPRQFQTNASLLKRFRFTETLNFDLRVDALNLTNNASFGLPNATFNSGVLGQIRTSVTSFSRRIQFSGKLNF
ncbi:MAG: TonB-dependent receptor [Pyrinomonadaceae bacterium]